MPVATLMVYDPYVTEVEPEAQALLGTSALNRRGSSARGLSLSSSLVAAVAAVAASAIVFGF